MVDGLWALDVPRNFKDAGRDELGGCEYTYAHSGNVRVWCGGGVGGYV